MIRVLLPGADVHNCKANECCVLCRDDARNVLVAMMAELGVSYLYFAIQVLQNACPAKGYTAHVLGYTLHAILEAISKVHLLLSHVH